MTADGDSGFVMFGTQHVVTILIVAALCVSIPAIARYRGSARAGRSIAVAIGIALVSQELFKIWMRVFVYDERLAEYLPLHLCGVAALVMAYVLLRRSYRPFEVAYFWGMGGALQAVLTPDLQYGFPALAYIAFFTGHGLIILGVLYAVIVFRFRPTLMSVARTVGVTLAYMLLIAPLNYILDTNYVYLRHKPEQASIIDFLGPWPWYIASLVAVGIVTCLVCYLPFPVADRLSRARRAA